MLNTEYKVVKLVSGENIICEVTDYGEHYEICNPLLMSVIPRMRRGAVTESLALSRWVQPFTEQKYFEIEKSKIILTANASAGLAIYYEKCLESHDQYIHEGPTHEELEEIDEEEYNELLEELDNNEDKIYH